MISKVVLTLRFAEVLRGSSVFGRYREASILFPCRRIDRDK